MSIGTITDPSTQREFRRLREDYDRMQNQLASVLRDVGIITTHKKLSGLGFAQSGHTGFASSAQLTAHTGDATIHFTLASVLAALPVRQASAPATDGSDGYLWIKTGTDPERFYVLLNNSAGTPEWHQVLKGRTP